MSNFPSSLCAWGWDAAWQASFEASPGRCPAGVPLVPARVIGREGPVSLLASPEGTLKGLVSGRLQHLGSHEDQPVVGDWVAAQPVDLDQAVIHAVLDRRTSLSRAVGAAKDEASGRERLLAANLDVLGIVMGLDGNFNPRRAQRLATLARHGGIQPLWILTKVDLSGSEPKVELARRSAGADPLVAISSRTGAGLDALDFWLVPGKTLGLAGSSGVGKTTLVNRLLGADLETESVRNDSKGRHTTTSRHLYSLPGGTLLMDTPGMRSVGLWGDEQDLAEGFADIETLAARCRYRDCRHQGEPGCAVKEALEDGSLDEYRWEGWRRQEKELSYLDRRTDKNAQQAEKERWKAIHLQVRGFSKEKRSGGR